jgi:alkylation response protein AidB-like acyl-CoA dehydrogenase
MTTAADSSLADAFDAWLAQRCPPSLVRAIEDGASPDALWRALHADGWLDALVPEARGGAGLALAEARPLIEACGRHAVPVPLAETLVGRGVLGHSGAPLPEGPLGLDAVAGTLGPAARAAWRDALAAARIAGAAARVLELSLAHAQQRVQFGRPIGAFQAVQHQLAVMAEQVAAARMASQLAYAAPGAVPDAVLAAMAKSVAGEAAGAVAAGGHAVHGAIGITAECDLQLLTRRLLAWRSDGGSPSHAARRVGDAWWAGGETRAIDFMLARLQAVGL